MTNALELEKFSQDSSLNKLQDIIKEETLKNKKEFNIFKVLKLDNYEIRHSNFLAWLLNPKETHGFGDTFLNLFLQTALEEDIANLINGHDVTIETEYLTNKCRRIDILIHSKDFVCVIENKYGSDEHDEQCKHYKNFIENHSKFKNCKNKRYIFLDINVPTEKQLKNELNCYKPMTYKQVLDILTKISGTNGLNGDVITSIIWQYIKVIEEKYPIMNEEMKKECAKLFANHKTAIDALEEYKKEFQKEVYGIFHKIVEYSDLNIINAEAHSAGYNNTTGCAVRFTPKDIDVSKLKQKDDELSLFYLVLSYKYEEGLKLEISTRNAVSDDEKRMYEEVCCNKYSKRNSGNFNNWHTLETIEFETVIGKDKSEIETLIKYKIKESGILEKFKDLVKNL